MALVLIPVCIPLMVVISIVQFYIYADILFIQKRSGRNGKVFTLYKFITMKDIPGIPESMRIPAWGRFLRKTGLDELPQIINIILGNMAFIGPRPLLPDYDAKYSGEEKKRLQILPGITGYSQALHRNDIKWEERLKQDIFYVHNASFLLDIKIIAHTIRQIFSKKPDLIMEPFQGSIKNNGD